MFCFISRNWTPGRQYTAGITTLQYPALRLIASSARCLAGTVRWTKGEEDIARQARLEGKYAEDIVAYLPGRSLSSIRSKTARLAAVEPRLRISPPFTPDEDARLLAAKTKVISWKKIAALFQGRSPASVKERYSLLRNFSPGSKSPSERSPFTPEDDEQIKGMRDNRKMWFSDIAKRLNRTPSAVQWRYNKLTPESERTVLGRKSAWSAQELEQARQLRTAGTGWKDIGAAMGRSPAAVYNAVKKAAETKMLRESGVGRGGPWQPEEVAQLNQLLAQGESKPTIARQLNRSYASLQGKLNTMKVNNSKGT